MMVHQHIVRLQRFTSSKDVVHFRPLSISEVPRLRDVWQEADTEEVRPCKRCPQLQLVGTHVGDERYADAVAVDTFHFRNDASCRRLVVNVEYYSRDMSRSEFVVETDYFM